MQVHTLEKVHPNSESFDRVMNWVVGALLLSAVALLVRLQAHPPL
jgi:hypothetical protein